MHQSPGRWPSQQSAASRRNGPPMLPGQCLMELTRNDSAQLRARELAPADGPPRTARRGLRQTKRQSQAKHAASRTLLRRGYGGEERRRRYVSGSLTKATGAVVGWAVSSVLRWAEEWVLVGL